MNIGKSISQTSFSLHLKPTASTFYCDYQGELYYNNINKMGFGDTLSWNFFQESSSPGFRIQWYKLGKMMLNTHSNSLRKSTLSTNTCKINQVPKQMNLTKVIVSFLLEKKERSCFIILINKSSSINIHLDSKLSACTVTACILNPVWYDTLVLNLSKNNNPG